MSYDGKKLHVLYFILQVMYTHLYEKYTYFTYVKRFYTLSRIIKRISFTSVPYRV